MSTTIPQTITVTVDRPGYGGIYIARHDGKVVMVKGPVMPGETVEILVDDDKKDFLTASAVKIIEPSPDRIKPGCKYYGTCGGCSFQHVPYDMQVALKEGILKDCLVRMAKTELDPGDSITGSAPWNYKIRAQLKVSAEGIGFHKKGTNDIVIIDECPMMSEDINHFIREQGTLLSSYPVKEVHLTGGRDMTAYIVAREKDLSPAVSEHLASTLMDRGISGVTVRRGNRPLTHFGTTYTSLALNELSYTLSTTSFVQSNWSLNSKVVDHIKETVRALGPDRVLDFYAGAGNFALPIASEAEVTAVEGGQSASEDGRRNAEINNIKNCTFIHSSAEDFNPEHDFDVVILDPPRPGLSKRAMRRVLKMKPENIIYISCNPATFSRDLKKLQDKYTLDSVRMVDFFPQTFHIEAIGVLSLK